jgi:predicted nucleic acid-binding protein
MIAYPDTCFLCALYRQQANSKEAARFFAAMPEALHVSPLLLYEFRQSVRLQVFLHSKDKQKGYGKPEADAALAAVQMNISIGALVIVPADWADVHAIAERLSAQYTCATGQRAFDILHIATAVHLGAREFLTFDSNQRKLAQAEGMKALP